MRTLAAIAAVCLGLPAGADQPKKDAAWTKVSEAGKFEVEFPGKHTETATPTGNVYQLQKTNPIVLYQVVAAPLGTKLDLTDAKAVKAVLDNAVTSTATALGGKIASDKAAKVGDKFPARDVDVEGTGLGVFRIRLVLTGDQFIQVIVAGPKEFVDGPDAKRFRESLKITAKD